MSNQIKNQYVPDSVSPPGETLLETLDELGMSQVELAGRTGRPIKTINEIIKGKASITPETALQLERVLGIPASFWNNRERRYREHLARVEDDERLRSQVEWLKRLPIRAMIEWGWIEGHTDSMELLREVLNFLGIASPGQWADTRRPWHYAYRESRAFKSDPDALLVWLRKGELDAQEIECAPYDANAFHGAVLQARALTLEPPEVFQPELIDLCARSGIAAVFVRELPKVRVCGATRWLSPNKALLQLSLRYKSNDQLWFSFFHEAGHILRHGKREAFIDEFGEEGDDKEEEADAFARDTLIPSAHFGRFTSRKNITRETIQEFARDVGVAPGIVVGRLQHDGHVEYKHFNDLKVWYRWVDPSAQPETDRDSP